VTRARDLFDEIAQLRARGAEAALATVVGTRGSVPGRDAMKMLVLADGTTRGTVGGGIMEDEVRRLGLQAIATESCRRAQFELTNEAADDSELICGGTIEVFVEPLTIPTCYVFGAGHLATAVAPVAKVAGFRVVVADDRRSHASAARFPDADAVMARPFPAVFKALRGEISPASYCVIVTRSHGLDERCAEFCLATKARYVGMIGSSNKVRKCHDYLESRGVAPKDVRRLRAPVGLDLGARTHGEIAVAIVAEMVRVRRAAGDASPVAAKRLKR
jgi:xanthine dehydrogenase accessory factor